MGSLARVYLIEVSIGMMGLWGVIDMTRVEKENLLQKIFEVEVLAHRWVNIDCSTSCTTIVVW